MTPDLETALRELAAILDVDIDVYPVADWWFDRFNDGYCWSFCAEWSFGTDDHEMSELRADYLGLAGPVLDPLDAARRAIALAKEAA